MTASNDVLMADIVRGGLERVAKLASAYATLIERWVPGFFEPDETPT